MGRHRIRYAAVVLAMAAGATAPAVAGPPPEVEHTGGCGFDTFMEPALGQDVFRGVVYAQDVAYSFAPERNPVTITGLRCELRVDDVVIASVTGRVAGPVGVLEPTPIEYVAHEGDLVDLCRVADTVDALGATASDTNCGYSDRYCPPEGWCGFEWLVYDAFDAADEVLNAVFAPVDPVVCPVLAQQAPYDDGVLRIDPDGDVYVEGELEYDCPPYGP
jgi:hypothetical protein